MLEALPADSAANKLRNGQRRPRSSLPDRLTAPAKGSECNMTTVGTVPTPESTRSDADSSPRSASRVTACLHDIVSVAAGCPYVHLQHRRREVVAPPQPRGSRSAHVKPQERHRGPGVRRLRRSADPQDPLRTAHEVSPAAHGLHCCVGRGAQDDVFRLPGAPRDAVPADMKATSTLSCASLDSAAASRG